MRKLLIVLMLILLTVHAPALAQVPTFSAPEFVCEVGEDELGCFGAIVVDGVQKNLKACKRKAKRLTKKAKRQRRRASRNGDTQSVISLTERIAALVAARTSECRACWVYDDPECDDDTGDGGSNENPTFSQACEVVSDPGGTGALSAFSVRIANGSTCPGADNSPVVLLSGPAICTGTLVRSDVVLTAAHCVVGLDCTDYTVSTQGGSESGVDDCVVHPQYNSVSQATDHDLALLYLSSPIEDAGTAKIHTSADIEEGELVVLTGYGTSEIGIEILHATLNRLEEVTKEEIGTFYEVGQADEGTTCVGDSGSPLFIFRDGEWKTVGALSNGGPSECAIPGSGASFDNSYWANLTSPSNLNFIAQNTSGVID